MENRYYLAIDIGASSGRHILAHKKDGRIVLEEIYRFPNGMQEHNGHKVWNVDQLFGEIQTGMKKCADIGKIPYSMGIDTWAVDFVLLDDQGQRIGDAVAYRDARTDGMDKQVYEIISENDLYEITGIQKQKFNTIYQLMALKQQNPESLDRAQSMLMIPDYFNFLLTGNKLQEYTNATTTQLVDPKANDWNWALIDRLGYPRTLFQTIMMAGSIVGNLADSIQKQVGFECKVVLPATHDTVGIHGNFDQAQTGVKKMFNDTALEAELDVAGYQFSSANSINIGRLIPQVAYYVYAYAKLYKNGAIAKDEKINVVVPTGNFGNILAAFYAKNMGLPIAKLICASNENKVLYDFFSTGTYDRNRDFILTSSPSMDILISSNLERLIYRIAGNDAEKNTKMMEELSTDGKYAITDEMRAQLADFYGNYTSEEETAKTIKKLYEDTGYIIDTHTAVAAGVYDKYKKDTGDTETKTVIASTASPFKFTRSVMDAIDPKYDAMGDFELVDELSRIGNVKVPQAIEEIRTAPVLHDTVCEVEEMPQVVKKFLGV